MLETETNGEQWLALMMVNNYRLNYVRIKLTRLIKSILRVHEKIAQKIS